jgi:hypothetical protein
MKSRLVCRHEYQSAPKPFSVKRHKPPQPSWVSSSSIHSGRHSTDPNRRGVYRPQPSSAASTVRPVLLHHEHEHLTDPDRAVRMRHRELDRAREDAVALPVHRKLDHMPGELGQRRVRDAVLVLGRPGDLHLEGRVLLLGEPVLVPGVEGDELAGALAADVVRVAQGLGEPARDDGARDRGAAGQAAGGVEVVGAAGDVPLDGVGEDGEDDVGLAEELGGVSG